MMNSRHDDTKWTQKNEHADIDSDDDNAIQEGKEVKNNNNDDGWLCVELVDDNKNTTKELKAQPPWHENSNSNCNNQHQHNNCSLSTITMTMIKIMAGKMAFSY